MRQSMRVCFARLGCGSANSPVNSGRTSPCRDFPAALNNDLDAAAARRAGACHSISQARPRSRYRLYRYRRVMRKAGGQCMLRFRLGCGEGCDAGAAMHFWRRPSPRIARLCTAKLSPRYQAGSVSAYRLRFQSARLPSATLLLRARSRARRFCHARTDDGRYAIAPADAALSECRFSASEAMLISPARSPPLD